MFKGCCTSLWANWAISHIGHFTTALMGKIKRSTIKVYTFSGAPVFVTVKGVYHHRHQVPR